MAIPINPVSLSDIRNEFGGNNPINLSNYYLYGPLVGNAIITNPAQSEPLSSSGHISLGMFRGISKYTPLTIVRPSLIYTNANGPYSYTDANWPGGYNALWMEMSFTVTGGAGNLTWSIPNWYNDAGQFGFALTNYGNGTFRFSNDQGPKTPTVRIEVTDGYSVAFVYKSFSMWW